jgi:hypothetical protein
MWNPNLNATGAQGGHGAALWINAVYRYCNGTGNLLEMSSHNHAMVDLLEIYHARALRNYLQRELKRINCEEQTLPGCDASRRRTVQTFYESMLINTASLLYELGDAPH